MAYILISIVIGLVFGVIFKFMLPRYFPSAVIALLIGVIGATIGGFGALFLKLNPFESLFLSAILATVFLVIDGAFGKQADDGDEEIPKTQQFAPPREIPVRICPACRKTYTDISSNFCLDDGAPLSNVMKIQTHGAPDETFSFSKRR